jgi:hypothetical protein
LRDWKSALRSIGTFVIGLSLLHQVLLETTIGFALSWALLPNRLHAVSQNDRALLKGENEDNKHIARRAIVAEV